MESEILVMFCISAFSVASQFVIMLNEVYPLGCVFTGLLLAYIISILIVLSFLLLARAAPALLIGWLVCSHACTSLHAFVSFCIAQMVAVQKVSLNLFFFFCYGNKAVLPLYP